MNLFDMLQSTSGRDVGIGNIATKAFSQLRSSLFKQEALTDKFGVPLANIENPEHKLLLAVEAAVANEQFGILNRLGMGGIAKMMEVYHPGAYKWHDAAMDYLASLEEKSGARALYDEYTAPKAAAAKAAAA